MEGGSFFYTMVEMKHRATRRNCRQRGGGAYGYTGSEKFYGINAPLSGGAPLSSAATANYIRPPMPMQHGGFSPSVMGGFAQSAGSVIAPMAGLLAYKTYAAPKSSRSRHRRRGSQRRHRR